MKEQIRAFWKRRVKDSGVRMQKRMQPSHWRQLSGKMDQRLCYGCGLPGHIKMNCPENNMQRVGGNRALA